MTLDLGQKLHSVQPPKLDAHISHPSWDESTLSFSSSFSESTSYLYFQIAMQSEQSSSALTRSSIQRTQISSTTYPFVKQISETNLDIQLKSEFGA